MTPQEVRAIAARVMAGENVAGYEILTAMGWRHEGITIWTTAEGKPCNMLNRLVLHSLDAADLLMAPLRERGWRFSTMEVDREKVQVHGTRVLTARDIVKMRSGVGSYLSDTANAPTEPRARTALALLCRAVEMGG